MNLSQSEDYYDSRKLQKQNDDLNQMNKKLIKELNSVKKQFQEATSIKDQMQKIHDTNAQLAAELRKARSEKEEYESRMKCNIESFEKKRKEMEEEKKEIEIRAQKSIEDALRSFAQEKRNLTDQVKDLSQKVQELEKINQIQKDEKEQLNNSCHDLLNSAQSYFIIPFKNIDQLTEHLSKSSSQKVKDDVSKPCFELNNQIKNLENQNQALQKKIKCIKQKLRSERTARNDVESQLEDLKRITAREKDDLISKNQALEKQLNEIVRKMKSLTSNDSSMLKSATREDQIDILTSKLEEQKEKTRDLQQILERQKSNPYSNSEVNHLQSKIQTIQKTLVSLKQQNTMLSARLKENDKEKEKLRSRNQNLQDENMQCTSNIQKLKDDHAKLFNECNSLKDYNDTLDSKYQSAQALIDQLKNSNQDLQCQNDKYQNALSLLQMDLLKQKQEIIDIVSERAKCINALQKQNAAMTALQDQLNQLAGDLKESQKKVVSLSNDLNKNQYLPKMEEIPETSWFCIDFPKELCNRIADEAHEETSTTIKLRRILSTIAKYYNSEIDNLNNNVKQAYQNQNEAALRITHLFSALSPMIKNSPPDYQTFITKPDSEKNLLQSISDLHDSQIDLKVQNIKLTNLLKEMANKLHADDISKVLPALDQMIFDYNNALQELEVGKTNEKKYKKALRSLKVNSENEKKQMQDNERDHSATIQNLNNENIELKAKLADFSEEVKILQSRIKEMDKLHSEDISYYQNSLESNKYSKQVNDIKLNYDQQLCAKDEYIKKAAKKIEKLELEISHWKRSYETVKDEKKEKEQQFESLFNKIEENSQEYQKARDAEINNIKVQYEKIIDEMKQKNKDLRNIYDQVKNSLNEISEQNKNLSSTNSQLTAENNQLKSDLQALQEESKREKQLNDAKMKAVNLSNDTQRLLDVENAQGKFDEEKRSLFEFVALSFHHLFDAREELNNESFKLLIEKASTELQKYIKQDAAIRRLLGIKAYESPEEAISKLLLSMYQH